MERGTGIVISNALSTVSLNFAGCAVPSETTVSPASQSICLPWHRWHYETKIISLSLKNN